MRSIFFKFSASFLLVKRSLNCLDEISYDIFCLPLTSSLYAAKMLLLATILSIGFCFSSLLTFVVNLRFFCISYDCGRLGCLNISYIWHAFCLLLALFTFFFNGSHPVLITLMTIIRFLIKQIYNLTIAEIFAVKVSFLQKYVRIF